MDEKESSQIHVVPAFNLNNGNYKKQPQPSSPTIIVVARQPDIAAIHTFLAKTPTPPSGQTRAGCDPLPSRCIPARLLILAIASRPYSHSGGVPSAELLRACAALARVADSYTGFYFFILARGLRHPREQKQKWLIKRGKTSQPDVGGLNPLCHFSSGKHLNTLHAALTVLR